MSTTSTRKSSPGGESIALWKPKIQDSQPTSSGQGSSACVGRDFTLGRKPIHKGRKPFQGTCHSDPCTPDAPPAATSPPTSEEPGPFTAPASPSCSSDTGTASLSPPLRTCVAALHPKPPPISPSTSTPAATVHPGLPSLPAPPASTPSLHPGIYLPVVPPSGATHLINWLPFLASATLATIQGKEEDQPPISTGSLEGMKPCSSPAPPPSHEENPQAALMGNSAPGPASPPPAAQAVPVGSEASANVSDILAELRTMNSHLSTIARALTQLASSLAPQQDASGTSPP